jgi:putative membrane protein
MLRKIFASWAINTVSFFIVSRILRGFKFNSFWSIVLAGILLGIVNATVKPVLIVVSLPFTILSLGLFLFVINALILEIVAACDLGFKISSFWDAIVGSILLSLFSMIITQILFPNREHFA